MGPKVGRSIPVPKVPAKSSGAPKGFKRFEWGSERKESRLDLTPFILFFVQIDAESLFFKKAKSCREEQA
jgi:hypothetical protein